MSVVLILIVIIVICLKINSYLIFCVLNKCFVKISVGINLVFILKVYDVKINRIKNIISVYKLKLNIKKIDVDSVKFNNIFRYLLMLFLMVFFFVSDIDKIFIVLISM